MSSSSSVSRRRFLQSATAGAVGVPVALSGCMNVRDQAVSAPVWAFGHGVASGDPLADGVIIWTRVTPDHDSNPGTEVFWVMATDAALTQMVASGSAVAEASRDYTVKTDVSGLQPATTYYYRFHLADGTQSPLGQTRTLPQGEVERVSMAVCSCSNYPAGLFNAYRDMAYSDAEVVLHLGDYIYEYGSNEYPRADAQGRRPEPLQEILTLADYRRRYAQYRQDEDLQRVHALKPFICIWDDHEIANDTWAGGAENHDDATEGDYFARRDAAVQAYHEWLPIRSGRDRLKIYRSFDFGNLLSLHMLETRVIARSRQLDMGEYLAPEGKGASALMKDLASPQRTLLGPEQRDWLLQSMTQSTAVWQVLGQQVLLARMTMPAELLNGLGQLYAALSAGQDAEAAKQRLSALLAELVQIKQRVLANDPSLTPAERARTEVQLPYNPDAWDGYMAEREILLKAAQDADKNLVVLAGDTHNAWASDLYPLAADHQVDRTHGAVGVEFATSSITSPGLEHYLGFTDAGALVQFEQALTLLVDDLKYLNGSERGYMLVEFTPQKAVCHWRFVDTIASKDYQARTEKWLEVRAGKGERCLRG